MVLPEAYHFNEQKRWAPLRGFSLAVESELQVSIEY